MISFVSLFVGLVFGIVNVQLAAGAGVDRVELFLDGRPIAQLRAPFVAPIDLGCDPAPHELVAVAFDAKGRRLDQARQWVNRPRASAEAGFVLEPGPGGRGRIAQLTWRSLTGEVPRSISVTFDEQPVAVTDPSRIEIPAHDPQQVHSLRAELDFGGEVRATAEAIFGGPRRIEAFTEMTAVAVELDEGGVLPPPELLAGWFEKDGVPLEVAAVEDGPADVVLVFEGSALERFRRSYRRPVVPTPSGLPDDFSYCFLFPVGQMTAQSTMVANVYPISRRLGRVDGATSWIAGRLIDGPVWTRKGQRLADAVAVASLAAAGQERRRAVVLILGPEAEDGSHLTPGEAMGFLEKLRVPLHVWSIGMKLSPEAAQWGGGRKIASARQLDVAIAELSEQLKRQRIVWVEGTHLPQAVTLSALATGVRLAR